jgi:hypothetical protein
MNRPGSVGWQVPVSVIVIAALLTSFGGLTAVSASGPPVSHASASCEELAVPAYFSPGPAWVQLDQSKPVPSTLVVDISGRGAGNSANATFRAAIDSARTAGIKVLGYIATAYATRPTSVVENNVRDYKSWYGVNDIFLDEVTPTTEQLPYYQNLATYIHRLSPGSQVWLNPGTYPSEEYMSVGNVVMVFEGTYATYLSLQVPSWVDSYPASKFAHTIYDTSGSQLANAFRLAKSRHAGYIYVTDGSGSDPYSSLPSYWSNEDARECK